LSPAIPPDPRRTVSSPLAAFSERFLSTVPPIVHFVFGLRPQTEPFHLMHYLALESCRRVLGPDQIMLHYKHLPYGVYWDLIRPELTLLEVDTAPEVDAADYGEGLVPERYRYAHHADFVRLDALIEHGGVYADIDTLFLRPYPDDLYDAPFVIGAEDPVRDEHTGEVRQSLCNALLIGRRGSTFAKEWRQRMGDALDGSWSNHSGFLARSLADELPGEVRVVPPGSFFPAPCTPAGLAALFESADLDTAGACSVHLWSHLWWEEGRRDFSAVHGGMFTDAYIRSVDTSYNRLARPYLPELHLW
jgi:hypothetical protein